MFEAFLNKRVLVTGHTGFKGSWLCIWLNSLGAQVTGLSLDPITEPSLFKEVKIPQGIDDLRVDIRDKVKLKEALHSIQPDYIFHLAAKSLVKDSYKDPVDTWSTNLFGTINLLEGLRSIEKDCVVVMVTSDKCYRNVEWLWGYREIDALGGSDPYSASKASCELAIKSYVDSFFSNANTTVRIASARAGNVIGGGDWSESRIIPDCVRAWSAGDSVNIRSPQATRPWQHVLEPLSGYLTLALKLSRDPTLHGESFNFGPSSDQNVSVAHLVTEMALHWDKVRWTSDAEPSGWREANLLKLNCDKASSLLGWRPALGFSKCVKLTADWYRAFYETKTKPESLCLSDIYNYQGMSKEISL